MNVGFIGLGHMGAGTAANLLRAGYCVTVYNRTPAKTEALVARGAKGASGVVDARRGDAVVRPPVGDRGLGTDPRRAFTTLLQESRWLWVNLPPVLKMTPPRYAGVQ